MPDLTSWRETDTVYGQPVYETRLGLWILRVESSPHREWHGYAWLRVTGANPFNARLEVDRLFATAGDAQAALLAAVGRVRG